MPTSLVLLVSRSASRIQHYCNALDQLEVSCLAVGSLKEVPVLTAGTPFSGILLDTPIMVKATPQERIALEDILKALPSAYLNITPASEIIKLMIVNGQQGNAATIQEFAELCRTFPPRLVIPKDRYTLYLHALLHPTAQPELQERTTTINLSPGGCFLFSGRDDWHPEQPVTIQLPRLIDNPVSAVVCWLQRWGDNSGRPPGIGVSFNGLSDEQRTAVDRLLLTARKEGEN